MDGEKRTCQCKACKDYIHKSDCAVHNEPAYRNGSCDCKTSLGKSFSAEDLKRLKEDMESGMIWKRTNYYQFEALLARLDAAEAIAESAYANLDSGDQYNDIDLLYEAWRKAAGK